jgi:tight adherence protein C
MFIVLRQIDLGADRREAFLALRERNESDALKSFVAAQLQAEELGVPLSEALNDIAADMRRMASQNARRQAQRASPRVSLLVTTLIVPGSMILILLSIYFSVAGTTGGGVSLFGG